MSHNLEDLDEIFYIISTTESQWGSNSWTKESDNYDFTIDVEWVVKIYIWKMSK